MSELDEIRQIVNATLSELRLHDQKMAYEAAGMKESQDRLATAVERISEATQAISELTKTVQQRSAKRPLDGLTVQQLGKALIVALLLGAALGGGSKGIALALDVITKTMGH